MTDVRVVLCTCPQAEAPALARQLVEERRVACVNIVPGLRSIYRWQGAICDDAEVLLVMKTTAAQTDALAARVAELHSYTCPEVLVLPVLGGHAPYLAWVADQLAPA